MSITIKPSLYATALAPKQEHIKPQAYATYLAAAQEHIKPQVYASYYFDKTPVELSVDAERKVNNPEFAAKISTKITKAFLPFDKTATEDLCGNTWIDSKAITVSSENAKQGKAGQFTGNNALALNGTLTLGGSDFTIDGWLYFTNSGSFKRFFQIGHGTEKCIQFFAAYGGSGYRLGVRGENGYQEKDGSNGAGRLSHFAVVYQHDVGLFTLYINGKKELTIAKNLSQTVFSHVLIGAYTSTEYFLTGAMDNFRVSNGARWTGEFSPPETVAVDSDTVALLTFDETATKDECGNAWTDVTTCTIGDTNARQGKALHVPSGNCLKAENIVDLNAAQWTVDCWMYIESASGENGYFGLANAGQRTGIIFGADGIYCSDSSGGWQFKTSSFCGKKKTLFHVAFVRDGSNFYYFENGVKVYTATFTSNIRTAEAFTIGGNSYGNKNDVYIDNFRITEFALWTENFTPPEQIEYSENTSVAINAETRRSIRAGVESSADTSRRIGSMVDVYSDTARRMHGEFVTNADLLRGLTGEESLSADTIIRLATKVSMDAETERTLMASVSYISDTIRALRAAQTVFTDSARRVATTQELDADTSRTINANIDLGNDTERKVHDNEETSADIMRRVATAWEAGFDGERTVQASVDVDADIRRAIQGDTKPRFSTMRRVALSQESTADTQRYIATGLDVPVDTGRSVRQQIEANSDTLRKVGVMKAFEGDAERNIKASVDVKSDLRRGIKNPFSFLADTIVQNGLATELQADTLREVAMSFEVDTKRTVNNPDFKPVGLTFDGTVTVEMPSVLAKRNVFTVDTNVSTTDQAFAGGMLSDAFALLLALLGSGGAGANFGQINLGGGEWEVNFGGIVFRYHDKDIGVNVADGQPHNLAFGFSAMGELEEAMGEFMVDGQSVSIFDALGTFTGSDGEGGLTLGTQGEPKQVIDVYQMNVYSTRRTEEEVQRDAMAEPPEEHDWAAILAMLGFNGKGDADDLDHIADDAAGKIKAILQGLPKVVYAIKEPFVPQPVEVVEDTMRRVAWAVEINADLYRYTCGTVLGCDTRRTLKRTVNARIDGQRQLAYTLNSATKVTVPTHKIKWSKSSSDLGTPWREPVMNFTMGAENELYNGTKDISIQMAAGSLTDNCSFSVAHGTVKIGECIQGRILDYEYQLMANHTSGGEEDVIQRISLTTSIDKLLYTSIHYICGAAYSVREVEQKNYNYDGNSTPAGYYTDDNGKFRPYTSVSTSVHYERTQIFYQASRHLSAIARALGLRLVSRFDDYTSVMLGESYGVSYQSLLSELFGWTSRLPQRQVNCFIRGGTLYVIQRGMESNTVDITGMERTSARYERELVRSIWNNADSWQEPSSTLTTVNPGNEKGRGEKDTQQPYTEYDEHTEYGKDGSYTTTQTTRQYEHVSELHDAVMIVHETEVCTTYTPMEKSTENVVVDGQTIEVMRGGGMEATTKVATTQHSYDHFGFHTTNTVVTQDGITLSANTSKTLGSTEGVTMYRNQTVRDAGDDTPRDISTDSTEGGIIYGTTTIDAEFPVYYVKGRNGQPDAGDVATMRKLTNAINWLNRKTKETVSLSVYNCGHIIGFDDRIILNGATYFLQSNNFTRNPTVTNRQDLTLVRWFKE